MAALLRPSGPILAHQMPQAGAVHHITVAQQEEAVMFFIFVEIRIFR
jgi:hypothetical protein